MSNMTLGHFFFCLVFFCLLTSLSFGQKSEERDSTKIDFTESTIEGRIKAPEGFFLQGRKSQAMSQMIKLRTDFRKKLDDSRNKINKIR